MALPADRGPSFSVIVTTYRRPKLLERALRSVLEQTHGSFECIVVDDGGNEVGELPQDPRVRCISRAVNGGPAAARNTGLAEARERYVCFLDDDDLYAPDRLQMAIDPLTRAAVCVCHRGTLPPSEPQIAHNDIWGSLDPGELRPRAPRYLEGDVRDSILDGLTPHIGQVTLERAIAPEFDESFRAVEDVDWWLRVAQAAPVTTVDRVGYVYAGGLQSHAGNRIEGSVALLTKHAEYFRKHPRAAAFRWLRIGLLSESSGDLARARRAYIRSLRLRPSPKAMAHLLRCIATPRSRRTLRSG